MSKNFTIMSLSSSDRSDSLLDYGDFVNNSEEPTSLQNPIASSTLIDDETTNNSNDLSLPQSDDLNLSLPLSTKIYKISIYSKVSGCRLATLSDQVINKQLKVMILEKLASGNFDRIKNYRYRYEKFKNGGLQLVTASQELISAIQTLQYFAGIPCKTSDPCAPRVVGFVRNLPYNVEPGELKATISKTIPEVFSVRYNEPVIKQALAGVGANSYTSVRNRRPSAFVAFNLRVLPERVRIFNRYYDVQTPNPMQCTKCMKFGHQGRQCRAATRCSNCAGFHSKSNCHSRVLRCVNCDGSHSSTSHDCKIWQEGKMVNEYRYRFEMTAEEAIAKASNGKRTPFQYGSGLPEEEEYLENLDISYENEDDVDFVAIPNDENSRGRKAHPRAQEIQSFLDLMSDFYLKLLKMQVHNDVVVSSLEESEDSAPISSTPREA